MAMEMTNLEGLEDRTRIMMWSIISTILLLETSSTTLETRMYSLGTTTIIILHTNLPTGIMIKKVQYVLRNLRIIAKAYFIQQFRKREVYRQT